MKKQLKHFRKKENPRKDHKKFHRSSRPHPMNRVVSFVSGHGIFRGGVQA